jgi:hypothetical protein
MPFPWIDFLTSLLFALLDGALLLGATLRLIQFVILDDLGRKALLPLETRLRARLSPARQWVADGFTCPFCIGMWVGLVAVLVWQGAYYLDGGWLTAWRILFGALALNFVVGHLAVRFGIYDDHDDQEA